jgi:hypothetical protein
MRVVTFMVDINKKPYKKYVTNQLTFYSPHFYKPEYPKQPKNTYYAGKKKYILDENEWTSLFIPIIDGSYTKEYLKSIIENKYSIGSVLRIDFVKLRETVYSNIEDCSVFIHFHHWYYNPFTVYLRNHLASHKSYNIKYYYENFFNISPDYFILMRNNSIVTKPHSSPHDEVVRRNRTEHGSSNTMNTLLKQQKRIELLEDELDALRKIVNPKLD